MERHAMNFMIRFLQRCFLAVSTGLLTACVLTPPPPVNSIAADLRFVAETARQTHPALGGGPTRQAFDLLAQALEARVGADTTPIGLYALSSRLLGSLRDGHTLVFPAHADTNLPLRVQWLSDGIVVDQVAGSVGVSPGDELLRVGRFTPGALLEQLRPLIPTENDGHIRALGAWFLPNANLLKAIGVLEDGVVENRTVQNGVVTLEVSNASGLTRTVKVALSSQRPTTNPRPSVGWTLGQGYGVFWLDTCENTLEYRQVVRAFFVAVKQARLQRIAIDVRQNGGGDSSVLDTLLMYLSANTVRVFHRPDREGVMAVQHPEPDLVFDKEVFVLTGPFTFSSANWIAGTIRDNRLGRTLGEATGNAPTSFGNVSSFTTPNLRLRFQVSRTLWVRPDISLDPASQLEADVSVPTTVQDVQSGRDRLLEWLKQAP